ncbi:hypothetical protein [Actinoplanes teichomyceticus]|uniref:Uncharacterized protein n=1 Tax=Actinoplanes teichomyceticus TaxID=1867 RepID=A0A561VSW3_ACTTI|nr:hypothetical protein [Actinoplanes teichomyceticus]TWG14670.1 hypothetical protein FHX34_104976 [Actinoplanes teichomyceticus]GIF10073.1 hypothetical protein Ate01nite_01050 [Actinoplanes teichomyceticus]
MPVIRLFLRGHHAATLAGAASALLLVAWWLAGTVLPVPQLLQGRNSPIALEMALPVLFAPLFAYGFGGVVLRVEHGSRRSLLVPDLVLFLLACAPIAIVAGLAALTGDGDFAAVVARNAAVCAGASLLLLTWFGQSAAVTGPILYFFVVSLVGGNPDGSAQWWALLRAPGTPQTAAAGLVLLAAGLVAYHRRARAAAAMRAAGD